VARRSARTGAGAPRFDHDDRLGAGDPGGYLQELAGVPEVLHVHEDGVDPGIVFPGEEEVVAAHVGLVAHGDELGDADAVFAGVVEDTQTHGTRLAHEGGASERRHRRGKGRVHGDGGVHIHDAHAVGSDHPDSPASDELGQDPLPFDPFAADFTEPRRDDHEPANAPLGARLDHRLNMLFGDDDDGEVHRAGEVVHGRKGGDRADRAGVGIHRVEGAGEAAADQTGDCFMADGAGAAGGTDDGDGLGTEDGIEHGTMIHGTESRCPGTMTAGETRWCGRSGLHSVSFALFAPLR